MPVNRYKQLLASIPKGSFYAADGQILPHRSSPYQLRISTGSPTTEHAIYLNNVFNGIATTDVNGVAIISLILHKGSNHLKLVNTLTQATTSSYITTRDSATLLASIAEIIENVDGDIEQVLLDSRLATTSAALIETVFGKPVSTANDMAYYLETYRDLLQELRVAYRYYGGTAEGVSRVVRAFTQVSPLIYDSSFTPRWVLGKDMLSPKADLTISSTYLTDLNTTNLYQNGDMGISIIGAGGGMMVGQHDLVYNAGVSPTTFSFRSDISQSLGPPIALDEDNKARLYDGPTIDPIIGSRGPTITINDGVNDNICLEMGKRGPLLITLSGGVMTLTSIASAINDAFTADPRYGSVYDNCAYVHLASDGSEYIALRTSSQHPLDDIILYPVYDNDATPTIFGITELPYIRKKTEGTRYIDIHVARPENAQPDAVSGDFVLDGTGLPNEWLHTDDTFSPVLPPLDVGYRYFSSDREYPFSLATDRYVSIPIPDDILKYKGYKVKLSIWGCPDDVALQPQAASIDALALSFDDRATYTSQAPAVIGTFNHAMRRPVEYSVILQIPSSATRVWARLHTIGTGRFIVHRVRVMVQNATAGLYLGDRTIPWSESKIKQGQSVYVWCKDELSYSESRQIGLDGTGHIDTVMPANSWLDKFNASVYSDSTAINVIGAFSDGDFNAGELTNLDVVLRVPTRFTHLVPVSVSKRTEDVLFSVVAPYTCTLSSQSDQILDNTILYEDGVPMPRDMWQFASEASITLVDPPNVTSKYTVEYNALTRFTTNTFDLGASYADYMWIADCHTWLRPEIVPTNTSVNTGIQFDGNGIAVLPQKSNGDQSTATLVEDTGVAKSIVPVSQWSFIDNGRISINQNTFNAGAMYTMQYTGLIGYVKTNASVALEIRSAANLTGVASATWKTVQPNTTIDSNRYHQMRVTVYGIRDVRDVRVQSLLLKGLAIFGSINTPVLNS